MKTDQYIFLTALRDRWVEGGLSANTPDLPITIKMGRSIVFRGEIGSEPIVDKLTDSHMILIGAAMLRSDISAMPPAITRADYDALAGKTIADIYEVIGGDYLTVPLETAIQAYESQHGIDSFEYPDHSHKAAHDFLKEVGLKPQPETAPVKGTINIELGGEPIFRYSGGKVDLDVFNPQVEPVEQVELETAALEAFGVSSEELADVVEGTTQPMLMHNGEHLTVESIVAVAMETPVESTPEVQAEALDAFGFDSVVDVVDEVAFNEPVTESFYSEPVAVKPAWMRENTTARVDQLRQTAISS